MPTRENILLDRGREVANLFWQRKLQSYLGHKYICPGDHVLISKVNKIFHAASSIFALLQGAVTDSIWPVGDCSYPPIGDNCQCVLFLFPSLTGNSASHLRMVGNPAHLCLSASLTGRHWS